MGTESFLRFRCHHCRKRLKSPLATAGKSGHCTYCGSALIVPGHTDSKTAIPAGQPVERVRGPFKSKILAAVIGLAALVLGLGLEAVVKMGPKVGGRLLPRVVEQWQTWTTGGVVGAIVLLVVIIALGILFYRIKERGELISRALKAPSGDDVIAQDGRPPILYLRSFADDTSFHPDHEQELVAALSLFGPVIAIGRPGESLQTLGAARVYLGDDWQLQIYQWIQKCAIVVIRVGTSPGLRWEIDTVTTCLKADKLLLQLPRHMTPNAAVLVDRLVRKVTRSDREDYDYTGARYVFFDKSLRTHLIKGPLASPIILGTDEENMELRRFYRQVFGNKFESFSETKKVEDRKRKSSQITFAGIATLVMGGLCLAIGACAFPAGVAYSQEGFGRACAILGVLNLIWGVLSIPAGIGALLRRRWGRVLCLFQSTLALVIGIAVFALLGLFGGFAIAVFLFYAAYAVITFIVMVFPKAGVFAPAG